MTLFIDFILRHSSLAQALARARAQPLGRHDRYDVMVDANQSETGCTFCASILSSSDSTIFAP